MYEHSILRINYTTYDVRRSQDVVKASTSHCNIIVLAADADAQVSNEHHPFRYARILGVYHVNAVYVGPGMKDYQPRRMEFLWVRWYEHIETTSTGWDHFKLHRIHFPPVAEENAFGFIDPTDILRCCHVIPYFSKGKRHVDGRGLSRCAGDSQDWIAYNINQWAFRI
jgi:hypothetical protein